jgi:hypothetical protein
MSSLGYSDFAGGGGGSDSNKRGAASADDGYIVAKRKNKTIKSFDAALDPASSRTSGEAPLNPKLERLKQSIAKIHTASSDDEDDDGGGGGGKQRTNMLPEYPGQGMGLGPTQKTSPPIADAGSGVTASALAAASSSMMPPPSTAEGYTQQPMFSMSQQSASRTSNANNGNGGGVEHFAMKMPSTYAAQYYKQYVPYNRMSNELSSAGANSDELIEKLNYIVHLLEEQHNERTDHVAEELVLYCFLGVFIIFIVDSFARAGKYTR